MRDPLTWYEVYIRAQSPSGKWWSAPAMELDDHSFRLFVLERLHMAGLVIGIHNPNRPRPTLRTRGEPPADDAVTPIFEDLSKPPPQTEGEAGPPVGG